MFSSKTRLSMLKAVVTKNSPFYIQFYISKSCYQHCRMCNIVQANADLEPFSLDKVEKIANNLVKIGAGVVLLTGGEPLMRSDIDEIVKIFKSKGLDVRMQSAGLVEEKLNLVKSCVKNGARDINISLDSLDENLSDYINGLKGSWRRAIKSIAAVSRVFPNQDSICALGCVLSPYNIEEIRILLEFADRIGWWLSLVPGHINVASQKMNFRSRDKSFIFKEEDFLKLKTLMKDLKVSKKNGSHLFDSNKYLDSVVDFVKEAKPSWRHHEICDSPNLYFAILPDGSFAPCADYRFPEKIYVYDDEFPNIYKSKKFRDKVFKITSVCSGCNYGSYPEMSLSVRSLSTIKERLVLQFRAKNEGIKKLTEKEIWSIIKEIKLEHKDYYDKLKNKYE